MGTEGGGDTPLLAILQLIIADPTCLALEHLLFHKKTRHPESFPVVKATLKSGSEIFTLKA
jgi:hypothetical protein